MAHILCLLFGHEHNDKLRPVRCFAPMCLLFQVLTQQIFSVVVAIGCAYYHVNVIKGGLALFVEFLRADEKLVIEFDQNDRAVNPEEHG